MKEYHPGLEGYHPGLEGVIATESSISDINGEKGILRYRGYPIEQLAKYASFVEVIHLLLYGELPNSKKLEKFNHDLTYHTLIHEDMKRFFDSYPMNAHPMGVLASTVAALSTFYSTRVDGDTELNIVRLLAKVKTIAAYSYRKSHGLPFIYPNSELSYVDNFLHMMFSDSEKDYHDNSVMSDALNLLLIFYD